MPSPIWRVRRFVKRTSWGKILVAGLAVAATAAITATVNHIIDGAANSSKPPVKIIADQLYDDCKAVPVYAEPRRAGDVPVGGGSETPARILIQGTAPSRVVVDRLEVTVVSRSDASLNGVGVPVVCQGDLVPRNLRVNLDDPVPRLTPTDKAKSMPITVAQDDPEQLVISPSTRDDVQWKVVVHLIADGEEESITVPEDGTFRTINGRLFTAN